MNKKALVIEDDKNIAELLRLYLEKDGFEVVIAADGGKGLQLATDEHPDVILSRHNAACHGRLAGLPRGEEKLRCAHHHADCQGRDLRQGLRP